MVDHPSLTPLKVMEAAAVEPLVLEATVEVAKEYLEPFQSIVQSRMKLRETEEQVKGLLTDLITKFDYYITLKQENVVLEKDVLTKIKSKLG